MVVYRSLGSLAEDRALAVLYRPLALTAVLYPPSHNQGRLTIGRRCQEGGEVLSCEKGLVYLFSFISKLVSAKRGYARFYTTITDRNN